MNASERLLDFFRREFQAEERSGFARLNRVPDSHVAAKLRHYLSLCKADRAAFADCSAHWAYACYSFVVDAPKINHTQHPFFSQWAKIPRWYTNWDSVMSVPLLRTMVQQYKIDSGCGVRGAISKEQFKYASSVHSVKAPELRKRVRAALEPFGFYKLDDLGYYWCRHGGKEFSVHADYRGRHAQLRYVVARPEFKDVHPLSQFCFERALGFGRGDWDLIVEENVDDVFTVFSEVVRYSYELPDRIRARFV